MPAVQFRVLESFPGKKPTPVRSKFKKSYGETMRDLDKELRMIGASNVVISLDCDSREIRNDGMPRSDCRPRSPAVVLSFESRKTGAMQMPCATYHDWQDNVRAIAMSLEALRAVDRYGVTQKAEQYKGWSKIAGPDAAQTKESSAKLISQFSGFADADIVRSAEIYRSAVKAAMVTTHPDRNGGAEGSFKAVQAAREILDKHHGI